MFIGAPVVEEVSACVSYGKFALVFVRFGGNEGNFMARWTPKERRLRRFNALTASTASSIQYNTQQNPSITQAASVAPL